jgi:hypothetical protein
VRPWRPVTNLFGFQGVEEKEMSTGLGKGGGGVDGLGLDAEVVGGILFSATWDEDEELTALQAAKGLRGGMVTRGCGNGY